MTMWVMSGIASTYCTTGQRSRQAPLYDINSHLAYGRGTLGAQNLSMKIGSQQRHRDRHGRRRQDWAAQTGHRLAKQLTRR